MENDLVKVEFNIQVQTLLAKGYARLFHQSDDAFKKYLSPLLLRLNNLELKDADFEQGYVPFVLVVKSNLVPTEIAMSLVDKNGKRGVTKLFPHKPEDFTAIEYMNIPKDDIYLITDIDRGKKTLNMSPNEARKQFRREERLPLTIDEGVALVTHYPEFLQRNNCFSLLASAKHGSKSVPAIWINAQKQPHLGWCWEGNPHTWLGSASCTLRVGIN